jgi:predicted CXXCH cytochrome family protein
MHNLIRSSLLLLTIALALSVLSFAQPTKAPVSSTCLDCHSALDKPYQITADQFSIDVHSQHGLTCASCHGGDPTSADNAMDPKKGFRGHVNRKDIPALCGGCHSDPAYMRQFNPSLRTDQLAQYKTSIHGKRLAAGDSKVAVCTDCHSVHGIRAVADTLSTVHPLNVAKTCSRCHSDADYMKPYGIPTDQYAGYSVSVHQEAMTVRGDLSAPTCTTCHGNHGAAPPGVASVENVCSTCHVLQSNLFDTSVHKKAFAAAGMPGCVTCHSNHRIMQPSDNLLGAGPSSVCTNCHVQGDNGFAAGVEIKKMFADLQQNIETTDNALHRASKLGIEVGEAELQQGEAKDSLTKARVTLHSFDVAKVKQDVDAANKIVAKNQKVAADAIRESNYRRMGLGVSLIAILGVLLGLRLYIAELDHQTKKGEQK